MPKPARRFSEGEERRHIRQPLDVIGRICGRRPVDWYTGRVSRNTRRLARLEAGRGRISGQQGGD